MSALTFSPRIVHSIPYLLMALLFATPSTATPLGATNGTCESIVPLTPGDTWRYPGTVANAACFTITVDRFDLGDANALVVELSVPAHAPRAHVTVVNGKRPTVLHQTAATLVLGIAPGQQRIRVATDDASQPLSSFRLNVSLTSIHARDEDDTELEPDPFVAQGPQTKDEDDTELELEPDPLMVVVETKPSDLSVLARSHSFVDHDSTEDDDHGDTLLHATRIALGQITAGDLTNGWGDDVDVFRFDVTQVGPVAIQVESGTTLDVELFDRHGLRMDVVTGVEAGARIVRTLVPGPYFVGVGTPNGDTRQYLLAVDTLNDR